MDDAALAVRAAAGDHGAFAELLDRHGGRVRAVAVRIAGNRSLGDDFCQEVFLHLLRVLDRYDPTRPFAPWLMHVATNLCLNRLRSERRRRSVSLDTVREAAGEFLEDPEPGPGTRAERADEFARVRRARDALTPRYRTILALRYEAGLSHREISAALDGLAIGTVKSRLLRARAALARKLEDGGSETS